MACIQRQFHLSHGPCTAHFRTSLAHGPHSTHPRTWAPPSPFTNRFNANPSSGPSRAHGLHLHGTKAALQFTSSKRAHMGSTKVLQQLTLTRTKAPQQCTGPIHATHEAHAWAPPFPPVDQDPFTHKHVDPPQLTLHAHDRSTSHFHAPPLQLHVDTRTLDPLPGQQFS